MRRALWLLAALSSVSATACVGQDSLDTWEDGIPASLRRPTAGSGAPPEDGGSPDADADAAVDEEDASAGAGAVGDPCGGDDECVGDAPACLESVVFGGFLTIEFPGGYCTETGCSDDADCPDGSACYAGAGTPGCNKLCETDADCRASEGYSCDSIPLSGDERTFCQPMFNLPF